MSPHDDSPLLTIKLFYRIFTPPLIIGHTTRKCGKRKAHKIWSVVIPKKAASDAGTTLKTSAPAPADSR